MNPDVVALNQSNGLAEVASLERKIGFKLIRDRTGRLQIPICFATHHAEPMAAAVGARRRAREADVNLACGLRIGRNIGAIHVEDGLTISELEIQTGIGDIDRRKDVPRPAARAADTLQNFDNIPGSVALFDEVEGRIRETKLSKLHATGKQLIEPDACYQVRHIGARLDSVARVFSDSHVLDGKPWAGEQRVMDAADGNGPSE